MDLNQIFFYVIAIIFHLKLNKKNFCLGDPLPYTYPASIRIDSKMSCVGALLTTTWIITICDCVQKVKPNDITVRVGMLSTEGKIIKALQIICSPDFISDDRTPDKNIALLKMPKIKFCNSVRQVALPILENPEKNKRHAIKLANRPKIGTSFSMNGWMEDKKFYTMKTDYKVRTWGYFGKVVSGTKCSALKLHYKARTAVKAQMFCAEFFHRETSNCSADRGTLMLEGAMLWGLMNYRYAECGKYKEYVPYIDLTTKSNLNFIMATIKG